MLAAPSASAQGLPDEVFELLHKEVELSREMLDLLEREKTALVEMDMPTLIELSRLKLKQVSRIQTLDESLQKSSRQLTGSTAKVVKLSSLGACAGDAELQLLEDLRLQLLTLREEILSKNVINKLFAEDTGRYLRDAISLITTAVAEQHPAYGKAKQGGKSASNQPSLISREV